MVPSESRSNFITHGFSKQGGTAMFEIWITNINLGPYLSMISKKVVSRADN